MTAPRIFWSKAALAAAGDRRTALQKRAFDDIAFYSGDGALWSLHVVEDEGHHYLFQCSNDGQNVYVQTAHYLPMAPLPDDHPDPERRGKVYKYPEADGSDNNEIFEETGMVQ